jgi:hypothetical protein
LAKEGIGQQSIEDVESQPQAVQAQGRGSQELVEQGVVKDVEVSPRDIVEELVPDLGPGGLREGEMEAVIIEMQPGLGGMGPEDEKSDENKKSRARPGAL